MNRIALALFSFSILFFYLNCASDFLSEAQSNSGEELSKIYCISCHQYPEPNLLNKNSWENAVLPRMGYMMGIYDNDNIRDSLIEKGRGGELVEMANIFPAEPQMDLKDWKKIKEFYLKNAPQKLDGFPQKNINIGLEHFKVRKPNMQLSPPSTTLVNFAENGEIFIGDAHTQSILQLDSDLSLIKAGNVKEGAVSIENIDDELWITVMGSFSPEDDPKGFILKLPNNPNKKVFKPIKHLRRPVHTSFGDLTGDGLDDLVVSEFGKWTGRLSLFINKGGNNFEQKILINQTGAIRSYLRDFNNDGLLDIIALFGQGNEGIYILYNKGAGNFNVEHVLQFSPSWGSSYFDVFDFNNDGYLDIIYCAGDNADIHPIMRPYHGIYIFQNDGKNQFHKTFFYQLNGAYAAIPRDFDLDGDLDIAAISFFPDYQNSPEESFVFLENDGNLRFKTSTFEDPTMGRWIVMDVEDFDQDGDEDLILGSLAFEVIPKNNLVDRWTNEGLPFIILENTTR